MPVGLHMKRMQGPGAVQVNKSIIAQGYNGGYIISILFIYGIIHHTNGPVVDMVLEENIIARQIVHQQPRNIVIKDRK